MKAAPTLVIAPVWRRVLAYLIDGMILGIVLIIGTEVGLLRFDSSGLRVADAESLAVLMVASSLYHIGFVASRSATPGKMAMHLYVAYPDAKPVRPDTAILRYLATLAEQLIVAGTIVSTLLMVFSPQRRTLHDRAAGTLVLMGRPAEDTDDGAQLSQPDRGI